ncbi:MAG: SIS domain-containing protein [Methylomarinum sp.]|nr:SIS domain-containing protein [Methylomarinum sp.]
MSTIITKHIQDHIQVISDIFPLTEVIEHTATKISESLRQGGKIFWMGNGGSAADCQHLAAEFVGRFEKERKGLSSIALTTDTSILTAVANDYGFEKIYSRQLESLCNSKDIVIGISTSGNSENIIQGLQTAKKQGAYTIGFTGLSGGKIDALVDCCIKVPSTRTARIQEAHILLGHIICDIVDTDFSEPQD